MERLHEKLGTVIPFLAFSSFKQVSGKTYMQKLFSTCGELRKKKTQSHYRGKNSSWLQSSSFDDTLKMNLTSYTNTNPAVLMEDFFPESTPHRHFLIS